MKITFTLTLYLKWDAPKRYIAQYIREAVRVWGGQRHPDDYMFGNIKRVTCVRIENSNYKIGYKAPD